MIRNTKITVFSGILAIFFLTGCSSMQTLSIRVDHRRPLPPASTGIFMAGTAVTDITPPPGITMAGYSAMAGKSRGYRGRLQARVIYLSAPGEQGP